MDKPKICAVDGCGRPARSLGLCSSHYGRQKRHGDPKAGRAAAGAPLTWLHAHSDFTGDGCLIFPFGNGRYGRLKVDDRQYSAHRVMCKLAHGEPPTPEHEAAHKCGNGHLACVHPLHLRWDTASGNQQDRVLHGTDVRGEKHKLAKLTEGDVKQIRLSPFGAKRLAKMYDVTPSAIKNVRARRSWAWVD